MYLFADKPNQLIGIFTLIAAVLCSCNQTPMLAMHAEEPSFDGRTLRSAVHNEVAPIQACGNEQEHNDQIVSSEVVVTGAQQTENVSQPESNTNSVSLVPSAIGSIARSLGREDVASPGSVQETTATPNQLAVIRSVNQQRDVLVSTIAQVPLDIRQKIFEDVVRHNFLNRVAFGKPSWARYFGDIGEFPALPDNIHAILTSPCPFWEDHKVYETHLLVLIPASVNGEPFSLNLLGALIQNPHGSGHGTQYHYYSSDTEEQLGAVSPVHSYWVLVTRDVLKDSRNKLYAEQQALVAGYAGYALPSALEAATAILMHRVRTGEDLFSDDPFTCTRCQDQVDWNGNLYPALVGAFSLEGISIGSNNIDSHVNDGVAGCQKL